jgi:hypothetical protein
MASAVQKALVFFIAQPENNMNHTKQPAPHGSIDHSVPTYETYQIQRAYDEGWDAHRKLVDQFRTYHTAYDEGQRVLRKELLEKIDALPSDFCNDGVYTDKEMVDCLAGVLRSREEAIREIIKGDLLAN